MSSSLPWIIAVIAIGALLAMVAWRLRSPRPAPGPAPLPADWDLLPRPVFTADERRLYRQLREALPHHVILAKLPLVRMCQPADPERVRYWYELLGAIQVSFAVCSSNGRVLAAIDLHYDRGGPPVRATRIKQSALGACRVRYLRCPADHLPSVAELQLLVPQNASANRGPQPAGVPAAGQGLTMPAASAANDSRANGSRRRERTTLWQDSLPFMDSFFTPERRFEAAGLGDSDPEDEACQATTSPGPATDDHEAGPSATGTPSAQATPHLPAPGAGLCTELPATGTYGAAYASPTTGGAVGGTIGSAYGGPQGMSSAVTS